MRDQTTRARRLGIAACIAALVLLVAALIVGKTAYSAPFVRISGDDTQGR